MIPDPYHTADISRAYFEVQYSVLPDNCKDANAMIENIIADRAALALVPLTPKLNGRIVQADGFLLEQLRKLQVLSPIFCHPNYKTLDQLTAQVKADKAASEAAKNPVKTLKPATIKNVPVTSGLVVDFKKPAYISAGLVVLIGFGYYIFKK